MQGPFRDYLFETNPPKVMRIACKGHFESMSVAARGTGTMYVCLSEPLYATVDCAMGDCVLAPSLLSHAPRKKSFRGLVVYQGVTKRCARVAFHPEMPSLVLVHDEKVRGTPKIAEHVLYRRM